MASEFCARCAARLVGQEFPSFPFQENNFDELIARLDQVMAYISDVDDDALNASRNRTLQVPYAEVILDMTGQDYVLKFFLPNFFFHITTAYDLLRHSGVPLDKQDFIGEF